MQTCRSLKTVRAQVKTFSSSCGYLFHLRSCVPHLIFRAFADLWCTPRLRFGKREHYTLMPTNGPERDCPNDSLSVRVCATVDWTGTKGKTGVFQKCLSQICPVVICGHNWVSLSRCAFPDSTRYWDSHFFWSWTSRDSGAQNTNEPAIDTRSQGAARN